jgi:hypothetical protein
MKSPLSKPRSEAGTARRAAALSKRRPGRSRAATTTTTIRREFRVWRSSLPTQLERDTLLTPEAIAESVVQEAECFLKAELPEGFARRLAKKAHHLYPRHRHFRKTLNGAGNLGRDSLYMYMRHWTASWLKRERSALHRKLPGSYSQGLRLPASLQPGKSVAGRS